MSFPPSSSAWVSRLCGRLGALPARPPLALGPAAWKERKGWSSETATDRQTDGRHDAPTCLPNCVCICTAVVSLTILFITERQSVCLNSPRLSLSLCLSLSPPSARFRKPSPAKLGTGLSPGLFTVNVSVCSGLVPLDNKIKKNKNKKIIN